MPTFYQIKNPLAQAYWLPLSKIPFDTAYQVWSQKIESILPKEEDDFPLIIALDLEGEALSDPLTYHLLTERDIRHTGKAATEYTPRPILTISRYDYMSGYAKTPNDSIYRLPGGKIHDPSPQERLDSRFKFFDSSIWHRYVPLYVDDEVGKVWDEKAFFKRLIAVYNELKAYHSQGLYNSTVAHESLEFQLRLLGNSRYVDFEEGHSKSITPDCFHSEQEMRRLTEEELLPAISQKSLAWRMLLIDDFAEKPLNTPNKLPSSSKSKRQILEMMLQQDFARASKGGINEIKGITVNIEPVEESGKYPSDQALIKQSLSILQGKVPSEDGTIPVYDVILLDYFLGWEKRGSTNWKAHYGSSILEKIKDNLPDYREQKLLDHFWIFPISVHPEAFKTHLASMGEENFTDHWNLSDGADPINCPQLFRYKLFKLMKIQFDTAKPVSWEHLAEPLLAYENWAELGDEFPWRKLEQRAEVIHASYAKMSASHTQLEFVKHRSRFAASFLDGYQELIKQELYFLTRLISFFENLKNGAKAHRHEIQIELFTIKSYLEALLQDHEAPEAISDIKKNIDTLTEVMKNLPAL